MLVVLDEIVARSGVGARSSRSAADFWTDLLSRTGHPLATDLPDENLVDWYHRGLVGDLSSIRVLDIGCGGGRNARWLAEHGALVDGVDIAGDLPARARPSMPAGVSLIVCDILRDRLPQQRYEFVYDSGCFHHLAPHRRETYLQRVLPTVAPGGLFDVVTFAAGKIDSPADVEILATGNVGGGIGYLLGDLVEVFDRVELVEARQVRADVGDAFGVDFLNAALFRRPT